MEATMARRALLLSMSMTLASFFLIHVYGEHSAVGQIPGSRYHDQMRKMQAFRVSSARHDSVSLPLSLSPSLSSTGQPPEAAPSPHVYHVTSYGADPTGREDSTEALLRAISDAARGPSTGSLLEGIQNLGGAQINLEGGNYVISQPLRLPATGVGNLMIHGGSLRASDDFPTDENLIDLSASSTSNNEENKESSKDAELLSSSSPYNYEYITIRDLMLDSNYRGGGIEVINSLRTSIDNCYITHFTTNGILVQGGHETYIRSSFLG
ncbi:hypothetical protein F2P56_006457 [Juglans regia]|uniref:Rhamnogalacturonase A/B/Epimerase-like pectate lyase domain-containing protein n=1 Tax=Juglans regia TaxID=51240 RepID=A0A833XZJ2_JUGRE|nr:hypothetical protein F2P56_006457 [Juglans regia]